MVVTKSDIDQLVVGYVSEENYVKTRNNLFDESPHLPEKVPILDIFGDISSEHRLETILEEYVAFKSNSGSRNCPICNNSSSLNVLWQAFDTLVTKIKSISQDQVPRPTSPVHQITPVSPSQLISSGGKGKGCFDMSPNIESSNLKLVPVTRYEPIRAFQKKRFDPTTNSYESCTTPLTSSRYQSSAPEESTNVVQEEAQIRQPEEVQSSSHQRTDESSSRRKKTITPRRLNNNERNAKCTENLELYAHNGDLSMLLNFNDSNDALVKVGANIITNMIKCAEKGQKAPQPETPEKMLNDGDVSHVSKSPFKNPTMAGLDIEALNSKELRGDLVEMTIDSLLHPESDSSQVPVPSSEDCDQHLSELRKLLGLDETSLEQMTFADDVFLNDAPDQNQTSVITSVNNYGPQQLQMKDNLFNQSNNSTQMNIISETNVIQLQTTESESDPTHSNNIQSNGKSLNNNTQPQTGNIGAINNIQTVGENDVTNNIPISQMSNQELTSVEMAVEPNTPSIVMSHPVSRPEIVQMTSVLLNTKPTHELRPPGSKRKVRGVQPRTGGNVTRTNQLRAPKGRSGKKRKSKAKFVPSKPDVKTAALPTERILPQVSTQLDAEVMICTSEVPEVESIAKSSRTMPPKKRFLAQEHMSPEKLVNKTKDTDKKQRSKSSDSLCNSVKKVVKNGKLSLSPRSMKSITNVHTGKQKEIVESVEEDINRRVVVTQETGLNEPITRIDKLIPTIVEISTDIAEKLPPAAKISQIQGCEKQEDKRTDRVAVPQIIEISVDKAPSTPGSTGSEFSTELPSAEVHLPVNESGHGNSPADLSTNNTAGVGVGEINHTSINNGSIQKDSDEISEASAEQPLHNLRRSSRPRKKNLILSSVVSKEKTVPKVTKRPKPNDKATVVSSNTTVQNTTGTDNTGQVAESVCSSSNQVQVPALINTTFTSVHIAENSNLTTVPDSLHVTSKKQQPKVHVMKPGQGSVVINLKKAGRMPIHVKGIVVQPKGAALSNKQIIQQLVKQMEPKAEEQNYMDAPMNHFQADSIPKPEDDLNNDCTLTSHDSAATCSPPPLVDIQPPISLTDDKPPCSSSSEVVNVAVESDCSDSSPPNSSQPDCEPSPPDRESLLEQLEDRQLQCHPSLMPYSLLNMKTLSVRTPPKYKYNNKFSTISPSAGIFSIMERSVSRPEGFNMEQTKLDVAKSNLFQSFLAQDANIVCKQTDHLPPPDSAVAEEHRTEGDKLQYTTLSNVAVEDMPPENSDAKTEENDMSGSMNTSPPVLPEDSSLPINTSTQDIDIENISKETRQAATTSSKIIFKRRPVIRYNRSSCARPKARRPFGGLYLCNKMKNMVRIEPRRYNVPGVRRYYMQSNSGETNTIQTSYSSTMPVESANNEVNAVAKESTIPSTETKILKEKATAEEKSKAAVPSSKKLKSSKKKKEEKRKKINSSSKKVSKCISSETTLLENSEPLYERKQIMENTEIPVHNDPNNGVSKSKTSSPQPKDIDGGLNSQEKQDKPPSEQKDQLEKSTTLDNQGNQDGTNGTQSSTNIENKQEETPDASSIEVIKNDNESATVVSSLSVNSMQDCTSTPTQQTASGFKKSLQVVLSPLPEATKPTLDESQQTYKLMEKNNAAMSKEETYPAADTVTEQACHSDHSTQAKENKMTEDEAQTIVHDDPMEAVGNAIKSKDTDESMQDSKRLKKLKRKVGRSDSNSKKKRRKLSQMSPVLNWSYEEIQAKLNIIYGEKKDCAKSSYKNAQDSNQVKTSEKSTQPCTNLVFQSPVENARANCHDKSREIIESPYPESEARLTICEDLTSPEQNANFDAPMTLGKKQSPVSSLQSKFEQLSDKFQTESEKTERSKFGLGDVSTVHNIITKPPEKQLVSPKSKKDLKRKHKHKKKRREHGRKSSKISSDTPDFSPSTNKLSASTPDPTRTSKTQFHQSNSPKANDDDSKQETNDKQCQQTKLTPSSNSSSTVEKVHQTIINIDAKQKSDSPTDLTDSLSSTKVQKVIAKSVKRPRRVSLIPVLPGEEKEGSSKGFPKDSGTFSTSSGKSLCQDNQNLVTGSQVKLSTDNCEKATTKHTNVEQQVQDQIKTFSSKMHHPRAQTKETVNQSSISEEIVFDFQVEPLDLSCSSWSNQSSVVAKKILESTPRTKSKSHHTTCKRPSLEVNNVGAGNGIHIDQKLGSSYTSEDYHRKMGGGHSSGADLPHKTDKNKNRPHNAYRLSNDLRRQSLSKHDLHDEKRPKSTSVSSRSPNVFSSVSYKTHKKSTASRHSNPFYPRERSDTSQERRGNRSKEKSRERSLGNDHSHRNSHHRKNENRDIHTFKNSSRYPEDCSQYRSSSKESRCKSSSHRNDETRKWRDEGGENAYHKKEATSHKKGESRPKIPESNSEGQSKAASSDFAQKDCKRISPTHEQPNVKKNRSKSRPRSHLVVKMQSKYHSKSSSNHNKTKNNIDSSHRSAKHDWSLNEARNVTDKERPSNSQRENESFHHEYDRDHRKCTTNDLNNKPYPNVLPEHGTVHGPSANERLTGLHTSQNKINNPHEKTHRHLPGSLGHRVLHQRIENNENQELLSISACDKSQDSCTPTKQNNSERKEKRRKSEGHKSSGKIKKYKKKFSKIDLGKLDISKFLSSLNYEDMPQ